MSTQYYQINGRPATAEEFAAATAEGFHRIQQHNLELSGAIDRVRRLHSQDVSLLEPGKWCPGCGEVAPCPTIRALTAPTPPTAARAPIREATTSSEENEA